MQILSIERAVIDVFGEMWGTMLLNCAAVVCSTAGLLGLCAREIVAIALVSADLKPASQSYMPWYYQNNTVSLNMDTILNACHAKIQGYWLDRHVLSR